MKEAARLVAHWYYLEKHQLEIPFTALVSLTRNIQALAGGVKVDERKPFNEIADALDAAYVEVNGESLSQSIKDREKLMRTR